MDKSNFHTHTYRCGHASGSEEDYVKSAIKNNIAALGFSDHGPFENAKYDFRMDYTDLADYIKEIDILKIKYKDKLKIFSGVEIEFFENQISYYEDLYSKHNLDYLLLGQHMWEYNGNLTYGYDSKDSKDLLVYGISLSKAMDTKLFKIIGHPDFYMKFFFPIDKNIEKITDMIINSAIKNNSILEFNANGIRCGLKEYNNQNRYMYPCKYFWDKVKDTNIKIMINSDCHDPNQLWDESMDNAYKIAEAWGLRNNITDKLL